MQAKQKLASKVGTRAGTSGAKRTHAKIRLSRPQLIALICAIVALALLIASFADGLFAPSSERVSYRSFSQMVADGAVASVVMGDQELSFTDDEGRAYVTDNPDLPTLKGELLLAGIEVQEATSADDVFNMVLDVLILLMILCPLVLGIGKLADLSVNTFKVVRRTGVTFNDVAGMAEVKRDLSTLVEVLKDPTFYARKGIRPVKGVILEGPPGNGKTLFARALASEAGVSFIATKGADFQSAFMSLGAAKIRALFRKAARHKPCIVFIDEFDSIGERRNYAGTGIDKENNRIITAMLNEMDGFEGREGILVVAATNSYHSLDPALVRPGRFDLKFTVSNPDAATRAELIQLYTTGSGRALASEVTVESLVEMFEGLSCSAIETCINGAATIVETFDQNTQAQQKSKSDKNAVQTIPVITLASIRESARRSALPLK